LTAVDPVPAVDPSSSDRRADDPDGGPAPDVQRAELRVDVADVGLAGCRTAAVTVVAPRNDPPAPVPDVAVCCLPGGGMSRRYFDLDVPGGGYSMLEHLATVGVVALAVDHPGVGGTDAPDDGWDLTPDAVADVDAAACAAVLDALRAGTTGLDLPPLPALRSVGVGHSAGGTVTVHVQARHRLHHALALLGWGGGGLVEELGEEERALAHDAVGLRRELVRLARARFEVPLLTMRRGSSARLVRSPLTDDVRAALVDARAPLITTLGLHSMVPGSSAPELATIDVPVFLGLGDHDLVTEPRTVPAAFPSCRDVTVFVLADAGHDHNVLPNRAVLWDRLARWTAALPR
jgi:alpha-beta hydrolase superfamily lysophospholipase